MTSRLQFLRAFFLPFAGLATALLLAGVPAAQGAATIETIAGGGPHDVAATSVRLLINAIEVDDDGVIYFAERRMSRIYKVDGGGMLRLVAGTGIEADLGDGGPIDRASFLLPEQVGLAPDGSLLVWSGIEALNCYNTDYPFYNRLSLSLRRINAVTGLVDPILGSWGLWLPGRMAVDPQGKAYFFRAGATGGRGAISRTRTSARPISPSACGPRGTFSETGGPTPSSTA